MSEQLLLDIKLPGGCLFENFVGGESIVASLRAQLDNPHPNDWFIYLWGSRGSGCTHLLQSACHYAHSQDLRTVYVNLSAREESRVDLLGDLEKLDLICVDELHAIAGSEVWEEALFDLFNRSRKNTRLLLAGSEPPAGGGIRLEDLRSRLSSGLVWRLPELDDQQKALALQLRAQQRGMRLTREVAQYIVSHCRRDTGTLFRALDRLDQASLHKRRPLTKVLVREVLDL